KQKGSRGIRRGQWYRLVFQFPIRVRALLAHLLYHVKVLSAQHVDVLSGVRTLRKQHVGWSGQSKW
ncbi:hypothetical protein, partial [Salmonella enterica]|uniref:hypothetical protein n=1 Tax=Salmonella enterica TaxID=28901 RepID=UPI0009AF0E32